LKHLNAADPTDKNAMRARRYNDAEDWIARLEDGSAKVRL
jgi:hypothetical protein